MWKYCQHLEEFEAAVSRTPTGMKDSSNTGCGDRESNLVVGADVSQKSFEEHGLASATRTIHKEKL
jgi:hypothetical protein